MVGGLRRACGLLLMWGGAAGILAGLAGCAGALLFFGAGPRPWHGGGELRGRVSVGRNVVQKIEIPDSHAGIKVVLEIEKLDQVDLDLALYDADPAAGARVRPACVSDGIGRQEVCSVGRPASGVVWAVVDAVGGTGHTSFRLVGSLIEPGKEDFVLPHALRLNTGPVDLGPDREKFRLTVPENDLGLIVLDGVDRTFTVTGEDGQIYRRRTTPRRIRYAVVGAPVPGSTVLYTGVAGKKRVVADVRPAVGRYRKGRSSLYSVSARRESRLSGYYVVFDGEQPEKEIVVAQGKVISGTLRGRRMVVYPVVMKGAGTATLSIESADDLDIAVCNELGEAYKIHESELELRAPETQTGRGWTPVTWENIYLIVFPSPGGAKPRRGTFQLRISPPARSSSD